MVAINYICLTIIVCSVFFRLPRFLQLFASQQINSHALKCTHTYRSFSLAGSLARLTISLVFTLCNPIKVHFDLMAFAFVQLFIFRRVTHYTGFSLDAHRATADTQRHTRKIINFKMCSFLATLSL